MVLPRVYPMARDYKMSILVVVGIVIAAVVALNMALTAMRLVTRVVVIAALGSAGFCILMNLVPAGG